MNEEMTDPLVRQIGELRAAFADSEARRAELEAVIEQLRDDANAIIDTTRENGTDFERGQENISERVIEVLSTARSVVLEDRDRENRAIGWDEGYTSGSYEAREDRVFYVNGPGKSTNPYRGDNR